MQLSQDTGKPLSQFDSETLNQSNGLKIDQLAGETVNQFEIKKKATYYLTEKAHKQMNELFIKGIAAGKKKDKSALVCEAIKLLYQKELS